jgi:hypothetical protein
MVTLPPRWRGKGLRADLNIRLTAKEIEENQMWENFPAMTFDASGRYRQTVDILLQPARGGWGAGRHTSAIRLAQTGH